MCPDEDYNIVVETLASEEFWWNFMVGIGETSKSYITTTYTHQTYVVSFPDSPMHERKSGRA